MREILSAPSVMTGRLSYRPGPKQLGPGNLGNYRSIELVASTEYKVVQNLEVTIEIKSIDAAYDLSM